MKFLSFIIASMVLLTSCRKTDIEYEKDFDRSVKALNDFKSSNDNSYKYEVSGSTWAGAAWKTSIVVSKGLTIRREFMYTKFVGINMPADGWNESKKQEILDSLKVTAEGFQNTYSASIGETLSWTEGPAQIGIHKNTPASQYLTLDEVYEIAKNDWLKKRDNTATFFETKNNGLISNCGYVPNDCQDDCFRGITISLIASL